MASLPAKSPNYIIKTADFISKLHIIIKFFILF